MAKAKNQASDLAKTIVDISKLLSIDNCLKEEEAREQGYCSVLDLSIATNYSREQVGRLVQRHHDDGSLERVRVLLKNGNGAYFYKLKGKI